MISVLEALGRLFDLVNVTGTETVPIAQAHGRILAANAIAKRTQPPFDASAMDGYAVRATEAATGATLAIVGEAAAGHRFEGEFPPASAVRIFTGAPVPPGADSILIQENATARNGYLEVNTPPSVGEYIRPAGGDFKVGDALTSPRRLNARNVALLAAMNIPEVTVHRRPVVALIPTGDELVLPGEVPDPDQIVTSNNFGLAAMLEQIGAIPRLCPIARDTPDSLVSALDHASGADFIVTLGGASVGDHDLVADVLGNEGLTLDFYKIAMRPGKPLMAGHLGDATMIGLPGNPVSAMVCGEVFLRPAVEAAMGLPAQPRTTVTAELRHDLPSNGPREHYMRAVLDDDRSCTVFENQDSSLVMTLSRANALVVRAPNADPVPKGGHVQCIPL
ncbi:MAG: gephyrin-like molybdotransferase Glp [Pseudomonadota bacterium]